MMKQAKLIYRFAVLALAMAMFSASFCACQSNDSNMRSETETVGQSVNSTDGLNGGYCDISYAATEIDSLHLADFKETDQVIDHVKITVKDHGDIVIRLRADTAPLSVANF